MKDVGDQLFVPLNSKRHSESLRVEQKKSRSELDIDVMLTIEGLTLTSQAALRAAGESFKNNDLKLWVAREILHKFSFIQLDEMSA